MKAHFIKHPGNTLPVVASGITDRRAQQPPGMSLVELLAVMAIVAVLASLTLPAFQSIALGSSLSRGGQIVADQLSLARQLAIGRNGQVQVWFVRLDGSSSGFRAMQLWGQGTNPADLVPLTRLTLLPDGVSFASDAALAPLLLDTALITISSNRTFPGRGMLSYSGFRFKAGGGTDLPFNATNAFVSVVHARDAGTAALPTNYCIMQIDPVNGRTRIYRP